MKTESEHVQRWDDIIFENRNKAYGAYAIRKSYDDNVLTGLSISLGVGCLIFFSSFLSITDEASIIDVPNGTVCPMPPPDFKPIITAKTPPPAPKQLNRNFPPVAVVNDVPDQPTEPPTPETKSGTDGAGNAVDGTPQPGPDNGAVAAPEPPKEPPFVLYAEHMPAYEGGNEAMMKFLQKKLKYPSIAQRNRVEGTVYVSFVISSVGAVTNVEVIKGISKECDKEAMRVISMMDRWSPGLHNKMPVAVKLILPIKFKLDS